jgi:hypothetical protein
MIPIIITILICLCFQAERGVFDFLSYLRLFNQLKNNSLKNIKVTKKTLFLLIPALNEQAIIENTLLNFCKIKNTNFEIKIAVLTSIRENNNRNKDTLTTENTIIKSINSGKLSVYKKRVFVFRDPARNGNMATQLNYAIKKIKSFSETDTFYIVYNADSIVSDTTFEKLSELMEKFPGKEFAFQQPCAFIRDMNPTSNQFTNALSLYQSWYCLGHESRIIRNYALWAENHWEEKNNTKLGVIVGHGSGMTLNINIKNNGYPTDLLTEDLTFGFILSANSTPILSLAALEIADVPNHFKIFIKQKSVWFWNFLGYANCYKKMRLQKHSRYQLVLLLVDGLSAGAYWFFDTFFIIIPLLLGVTIKSPLTISLSLVSYIIFYIVPQYFLLKKLPNVLNNQGFHGFAKNVKSTSFIRLLPSLCLITLTNSVGAWVATIKFIKYLFTKQLPVKYKTGD